MGMAELIMNSPLGKALLAAIRGGDYAHPGEEECIERLWAGLPHVPTQSVLDAGCGRAGTAAYVQRRGWGRVTGFDLDAESIAQAQATYPELQLFASDVLAAPAIVGPHQPDGFDVIYLLSAFYAFPDQPAALRDLRTLAHPGTRLALLDYTDADGRFASSPPGTTRFQYWQPLRPARLRDELAAGGWRLDTVQDLGPDFKRWYAAFLQKIAARRTALDERFGVENVDFAQAYYADLLDGLMLGHIGGLLAYASAV
jgi:SAM-dependent methyltransferase